jgi:hypothetical protein
MQVNLALKWLSNVRRGQRFNRTRQRAYDYNEIYLENGKILNSYVPGEQIISRKATNFDNIKPETLERYMREINQKYPPGTRIRSGKYSELNRTFLRGRKILEVPDSNLNAKNRQAYEAIAKQHGVEVKYVPEE